MTEGPKTKEKTAYVKVFFHMKTRDPTPEITLYYFAINAKAWIIPAVIRDSEEDVQCVELCKNPAMFCESLGSIVDSLLGYRVQVLDLSFNPQLGDGVVTAIQPLLEAKRSRLTDLKLASCGLTADGLKYLVKVAKRSTLRLLDISYTQIRDESELVEQVLELPMVEQLAFCCCDLSPDQVRTIAECLPFTSIKSLDLAGNEFGSEGLVYLASKLSESMVEELDLSGIGIETECEGLSQLAKAWVERPFSNLCIKNNYMGQADILSFIATLRTLRPVNDSSDLALVDSLWMVNGNAACC